MIKTNIFGGLSDKSAEIVQRTVIGQHLHPAGLSVYTQPYSFETNRAFNAVDSSGSTAMNVNGSSAGGTPDPIHDGIDSVLWTGSNLNGSSFVFDSTAQAAAGTRSIDGTATVNNDQALLTRSAPVNIVSYTGITGSIYVNSWPATGTKEVRLKFRLAGVDIGLEVDISSFIDITNQNTWQTFIIPFTGNFNLSGSQLDELVITTIDVGGGQAPNYYLDSLALTSAAGGAPRIFRLEPRRDELIYVKGIEFVFVFPFDPVATVAGATENFTAQYLTYNKFLHLAELANGLIVRRVQNERTLFSSITKNNFDLFNATNRQIDLFVSDNTNTILKVSSEFTGIVEIDSTSNDRYEFVVQDDLSSLVEFRIRAKATTVAESRPEIFT
jgi:hypothetical protein